jgi:hypothetical protein
MRRKLFSLVAGGLASVSGWVSWSASAAADEPRTPVVPVQTAISTDSSVPVQFVDHRRYYRGSRGYRNGYYDYGYYSYPRYRYYSSYPRYYYGYGYPYRSYYSSSYYDPYYYPSGTVYFSW